MVSIRRRCAASQKIMLVSTFRKIVGQRLIRRAHGYLTAQTNCYEGICCSGGGVLILGSAERNEAERNGLEGWAPFLSAPTQKSGPDFSR